MKKLLIALALVLTLSSITPSFARAENTDLYTQMLNVLKVERTDAYAIDYFRLCGPRANNPLYIKYANQITEGITGDYEKAKAIFEWVVANSQYAYYSLQSQLIGLDKYEEYGYMQFTCVGYANTTQGLFNAAGLPAKTLQGIAGDANGWELHDWVRVYADGRWIHADSTWGEFDIPDSMWARTHSAASHLLELDEQAWDGSLVFYDGYDGTILKVTKKLPLNSILKSSYGYDPNALYLDWGYTEPVKLNELVINSQTAKIIVNPDPYIKKYTVKFNSNKGSAVKSLQVEEDNSFWKPKNPTRKGYKFAGWYRDSKLTKKWDFDKNVVTKNITLYAKWQKKQFYQPFLAPKLVLYR